MCQVYALTYHVLGGIAWAYDCELKNFLPMKLSVSVEFSLTDVLTTRTSIFVCDMHSCVIFLKARGILMPLKMSYFALCSKSFCFVYFSNSSQIVLCCFNSF